MQRSADRILTTHCGSLPRPHDLLDMMKAKLNGDSYDEEAYAGRVSTAVSDIVRKQSDCGVDIPCDGEQGKPGFFTYVGERLNGFDPDHAGQFGLFAAEVAAFPEYYERYFAQAMLGGTVAPMPPLACTGSVTYCGDEAVQRDIANLRVALEGLPTQEAFMPSVSPSGVGVNKYYSTDEEYLFAVAEAMRSEYQAIVDAGLVLQIDDPFLTDVFGDPALSEAERRKKAEIMVAAVNHGIRGIPEEKIRFHTCYGINHGPRVHDAELKDVLEFILKVNAGAYSFENGNARHEHEYHIWEDVKLADGKVLVPGIITHSSNIVEHPELIAERIIRFTRLVGRENVLAGNDCGFSSQATYNTEVHPTVVWAKFRALAEGAALASRRLW